MAGTKEPVHVGTASSGSEVNEQQHSKTVGTESCRVNRQEPSEGINLGRPVTLLGVPLETRHLVFSHIEVFTQERIRPLTAVRYTFDPRPLQINRQLHNEIWDYFGAAYTWIKLSIDVPSCREIQRFFAQKAGSGCISTGILSGTEIERLTESCAIDIAFKVVEKGRQERNEARKTPFGGFVQYTAGAFKQLCTSLNKLTSQLAPERAIMHVIIGDKAPRNTQQLYPDHLLPFSIFRHTTDMTFANADRCLPLTDRLSRNRVALSESFTVSDWLDQLLAFSEEVKCHLEQADRAHSDDERERELYLAETYFNHSSCNRLGTNDWSHNGCVMSLAQNAGLNTIAQDSLLDYVYIQLRRLLNVASQNDGILPADDVTLCRVTTTLTHLDRNLRWAGILDYQRAIFHNLSAHLFRLIGEFIAVDDNLAFACDFLSHRDVPLAPMFVSAEDTFEYAIHECMLAKFADKAEFDALNVFTLWQTIEAHERAPQETSVKVRRVDLGGGVIMKSDSTSVKQWGQEAIRTWQAIVPDFQVTSDRELRRVARECGLTPETLNGRACGLIRLLV